MSEDNKLKIVEAPKKRKAGRPHGTKGIRQNRRSNCKKAQELAERVSPEMIEVLKGMATKDPELMEKYHMEEVTAAQQRGAANDLLIIAGQKSLVVTEEKMKKESEKTDTSRENMVVLLDTAQSN